jgi:hypothetical protein
MIKSVVLGRLAIVAIMVGAPFVSALPASANTVTPAEQNNTVSGYTNKDSSWTVYTNQRHHTDYGDITFQPDNLPSGGMCIRLRSVRTGAIFSGSPCFTDHSKKFVATGVLAGTTFTVEARKLEAAGTDTYWHGTLYY